MKAQDLINRFPKIKKMLIYIYDYLYIEFFRGIIHSIHLLFPNEYSDLKRFKDIHKGEMCFIIGTGPSLRIEDLNKLKQHSVCTFSMNSIIKAFDQTEWRPNYYGVQDSTVYKYLKSCYKKSDFVNTEVFYADWLHHFPIENGNKYYANLLWHWNKHKKQQFGFSTQIDRQICDGYSSSYVMLQIAVYMGFSEIYLLGLDSNVPSAGNAHLSEAEYLDNASIDRLRGTFQGQINAFEYAANYLRNSGVHIYNATRGGCLEVFPRANFDELWT